MSPNFIPASHLPVEVAGELTAAQDAREAQIAERTAAAVAGARRSDSDTAIRAANAHLPAGEVT